MIQQLDNQLVLDNGLVRRVLTWNQNGFYTNSLCDLATGQEYVSAPLPEFNVTVNGVKLSSYSEARIREVDGEYEASKPLPKFLDCEVHQVHAAEGATLHFALPVGGVELFITYWIWPELSGFVKSMEFKAGGQEAVLEHLDIDHLCCQPGLFRDCIVTTGSDDAPQPACFAIEGDTDILHLHNAKLQAGFLYGMAVPGPLRRILCYPHWKEITGGYAWSKCPFRKHLEPGETFVCDASALLLYHGDAHAGDHAFAELVRKLLPPPGDPGVMYCTWQPFLTNIHEELVLELAREAADMGFKYLVIDDGWFRENREVDPVKFPHGMAWLSDQIRAMGIILGLWYNIGTDYHEKELPTDWWALNADGTSKYCNVNHVLCFGSDYRERILEELAELAERYKVGYFKLDFSSIVSPYEIMQLGCHAKNHAHHREWEDSAIAMYRGMKYMRDGLKTRFPELLVDFSFETFGPARPNIAAISYSELNHVSNHTALQRDIWSIARVRQDFYRWYGKLPTERLLGGLLTLQYEDAPEYLLTAMTGAPLVAGDLRQLEPEKRRVLKEYTGAYNRLTAGGQLTRFTVLANEPDFDAYLRTRTDGHGFLAVFNRRDTALETDFPTPFPMHNVLDGSEEQITPPNSCAMFVG
ncbi:MAG: alpha-galactosidase [Victivallales bacterium]|nr:alpha-galactosidase [Victivallales bacterium]